MSESRTIRDPFLGKDVEISDRLVDRLRGKYAIGPTLPNGEPEFGWRDFPSPPIQQDAANEIERLRARLQTAVGHIEHMAAWITQQNAGYSFESLGEDMPGLRDLPGKAT